jgi:hypothetical protein
MANLLPVDLCSSGFLILILLAVGGMMVRDHRQQVLGYRLAAIAYVAFLALAGMESSATTSGAWASLAFRGLFVAGIVLGIAWMAMPLLGALHHHLIRRPFAAARRSHEAARSRRRERADRRRADEEERLKRAAHQRGAPDRERARLKAEEEAKVRSEAQRRRTEARRKALLDYALYAPKLGDRFPRPLFDEYVQAHMADTAPPEDVERSGAELRLILESHAAETAPAKKETTLGGLTQWYQDMKRQVEALQLDDEVKEVRLIELERRFEDLLKEHLEKMRP